MAGYVKSENQCLMKLQLGNDLFAGLMLGISWLLYFIAFCRYHYLMKYMGHGMERNEELQHNYQRVVILAKVYYFLGYGLYFFMMQIMWRNVSDQCFEGWNILFIVNFFISMVYCATASTVFACFILFLPCCFPFYI
jgi:hypothetical protein